jgi:hypothetical protein
MTECQIPPEPEIGRIGNWDPCFKPGPCPCPNPCTWVAPLILPRLKPEPLQPKNVININKPGNLDRRIQSAGCGVAHGQEDPGRRILPRWCACSAPRYGIAPWAPFYSGSKVEKHGLGGRRFSNRKSCKKAFKNRAKALKTALKGVQIGINSVSFAVL